MNDHIGTPTLAQLTAEVAALRAQQTRYHTRTRRRSTARLRRFVAAGLVALLVALVPLALLAANPFNDLNPGSVHNANIDAIYNAGITTGCVPNVSYCPNDYVTREQMASFLARTAGLGANPPVANALTAVNAAHAINATTAQKAAGLDTNPAGFGTYAANGLVRVARGSATAIFTPPTGGVYATGATVTITAPGEGFVFLSGSIVFSRGSAACPPVGCVATARLRDTAGSGPLALSQVAGTAVQDSLISTMMPLTWVFYGPAAGARTYVLEITAVQANTSAGFGQLSAIYIPFDANGFSGASLPDTTEPAP